MRFPAILTLFVILGLVPSCGNKPAQPEVTPADPAGLAVEQLTSRSARLTWAAAGDAASYYVFARPEHEAYYVTPVASLPAGISSYEFSGLTPGASYYFGVQAVGKEGKTLSKISYSELTKIIDYENLPRAVVTACEAGYACLAVRYKLEKVPEPAPEHGICLSASGTPTVDDICLPGPALPDSREVYQAVPGAVLEAGRDYRMSAYVQSGGAYWYSEPAVVRLADQPAPIHLDWTRVPSPTLPSAIEVYETVSSLNGRAFHAWYAIADCTGEVEFRVQNPSAKATVDAQAGEDCYVLINGGIYGTQHIGVIIADGVKQAWRNEVDGSYWSYDSKLYPITRAAFGTDASGKPATWWVSAPSSSELYWYGRPLPTVVGEALYGLATLAFPGPAVSWSPRQAISTGPMLLYKGQCCVDRVKTSAGHYRTNYEAWAQDIFSTRPDRTAVGCTSDGRIILFVCDGRIASSDGAYVDEVALILRDLGCVGAINLDGGGSTGMVVAGKHVNDMTGGNRAVLSTLGFFKRR